MCTIAYVMIGYNPDGGVYFKYLIGMLLHACNCSLYCLSIGCMFLKSSGTATLVSSILILFQMLFAGVLLNQNQIPSTMKWIQYTSLVIMIFYNF